MTPAQLEKTLLQYTKGLSKEALLEILDFVQFVRQKEFKKSPDNIKSELTRLNESQTSHLEDEFEDYRKIYPVE